MKAKKLFLAAIALTCIFSTYNSFSYEDNTDDNNCFYCETLGRPCPDHEY